MSADDVIGVVQALFAQLDHVNALISGARWEEASAIILQHDLMLRDLFARAHDATQGAQAGEALRLLLERERDVLGELERARDETAAMLSELHRAHAGATRYAAVHDG